MASAYDDILKDLKEPSYTQSQTIDAEDENEVSTITSVLSGLGSGLFKIPEGFFSLGAALMDLGADTNKVAEVEKYFAKINPFDEAAEATAAGKITELIVNLAVPGGIAFKAGSGLAKSAIAAKKAGKYLSPTGQAGKNISKGIQKKLKDVKLRGWDRAGELGAGALAGGVAEGIFVGDVEDAGTFGDLLGGPTQLEREMEGDTYDPAQEIINRVKFGTEGALFTGVLGGIGATIGKLRDATRVGKAADSRFNKFLEKWGGKFRSRQGMTPEAFKQLNLLKGARAADLSGGETFVRNLDDKISKLFPFMKRAWGDKTTYDSRRQLLKQMNRMLLSSADNPNQLNPIYKMMGVKRILNAKGKKLMKEAQPLSGPRLTERGIIKHYLKNNKIKDLKKFTTVTDEGIESISFGKMNKKLMDDFAKTLKKTYKAKDEDIAGIFANLAGMRMGWGELFTSMGRRLDKKGVKEFKELFGNKVTTWLDSSYDVFKNRKAKIGEQLIPTAQVMSDAKKSFKQLYRTNTGGKELSDAAAQNEVLKVYNSVINPTTGKPNIDQSFKLASKSDPYFKVPDFFLGKSSLDEALHVNNVNLSNLTGTQREVIENLFGKGNDAFQTILEATQKLSAVVRRNEYFDNLVNESNRLRELRKVQIDEFMKQGLSREEAGRKAVVPIFANSETEAAELFGGMLGADWRATVKPIKSARGFEALEQLGPVDYRQTLRPLAGEKRATFLKKGAKIGEVAEEIPIHNPLAGKYAMNGVVDGLIEPVDSLFQSKNFGTQLYANFILYPKATSQMAKTILAPFTHGRNFLSAGAFAMANGIIPFSDLKAVKAAYNALQVAGPGTRKSNQFYQKLLKLGVVNSQVQLGDLMNLLKDVRFGTTVGKLGKARYSEEGLGSYGLNRLMKTLSNVKKFSQDAYTAEDDFWKIFTWFGERGRLDKSLKASGLSLGQEIKQVLPDGTIKSLGRFTDDWLDERAADLVKNNVPNYAFVSDFVKGLRKWPVGNFVAFPSEIMRTGTNIVDTGLNEIFNFKIIGKQGKVVTPFRTIGLRRLGGMAFTTAAVPYAAVEGMSALYDVTQDERAALRRYVADWSKNSTLVPLRDKETGKLKYVDFSHANAYDTLSRPIQTVINRVQAGETDKDGIMNDFIVGLAESTKELALPFISESIWTEALADVSVRRGMSPEGFKIWNDEDSLGRRVQKGVAHLAMAQAPLNWKQLKRMRLSMKPVDDLGRFDDRGNEYEFGNEAAGIVGLRAIDVDPEKGLKYKIANYKKGARNSKALFTTEVLKGGVTTPKAIIDAYINANRALFLNQKNMYDDIEAAKILGIDKTDLGRQMISGIGKKGYGRLSTATFTPISISKNVVLGFQRIADELEIRNPLLDSMNAIANIRAQLFNVGLDEEAGIPAIDNPFDTSIIPDLVSRLTNQLPPLPDPTLNTGTQFGNVNTNVNVADQYAALFPRDELGKGAAASLAAKKPTILGQP